MKLARYISEKVFEQSISPCGLEIWFQPPTAFEDGIEGFGNGFAVFGYLAEYLGGSISRVEAEGGKRAVDRVDMVENLLLGAGAKKQYGEPKFSWYDRLCEAFDYRQKARISCWFMQEHESLAMWELYSKEGGVCIEYEMADLICEMRKQLPELTARPVVYERLHEKAYNARIHLKPESLLVKDRSYEHEKEFRFITLDKTETPFKLRLPLPNRIVVSPKMGLGTSNVMAEQFPFLRTKITDSALVGLAKHSEMKQFLTDLYNEKDEFAPRLARIRASDLKKSHP